MTDTNITNTADTNTINTRFIPRVGQMLKLKTIDAYTARHVHVWSWLRVETVNTLADTCTMRVLNGNQDTEHVLTDVPFNVVDSPLGWQPVYTMFVSPEKLSDVLSWLRTRGLIVRASADLSSAGQMTFQPADNAPKPHWKYPEITDTLTPFECTHGRVRVFTFERVIDAHIPSPCTHCNATGKRPYGETDTYQGDVVACAYCRDGVGKLYVSGTGGKTRKAIMKQLNNEGWEVEYDRHMCAYVMERKIEVNVKGE
jgi:hypothetical protein